MLNLHDDFFPLDSLFTYGIKPSELPAVHTDRCSERMTSDSRPSAWIRSRELDACHPADTRCVAS